MDELKSFINNCELPDKKSESLIHEFTPSLLLIPGSALQEYSLRHATKHKARLVADKLYKILSGSYTVQPTTIKDDLDEVDKLIMQIFPSHSESIEVSTEIQGWFESFVEVDPNYFNWNLSFRKESVYG